MPYEDRKVTLYKRDVDKDVWEWADQRADEKRISLSRLIVDTLRDLRDHDHAGRSHT